MLDPQASTFKRLRNDAALMALLGTHEARPAIFSTPVPHNLDFDEEPALFVDGARNAEDADTYTEFYRVFDLNVRLYNRPENGTDGLKAAADRARIVLKTWLPEFITGGKLISATVTGPVEAPTEEPNNAGRLLNVRLLMQEI